MKLKKQNIILHQLFILLCENEYLSVKKISSILNVSESTIRRCLIQLNETLAFNQCGKINKKPRRGISLILTNKEVAERIFANYELKNLITGKNQIYRYLMLILSSNANKITLNELSEKLYDSLPVVRKNLDTCAKWLHLFDLNMNIKKIMAFILREQKRILDWLSNTLQSITMYTTLMKVYVIFPRVLI